MQTLLRQKPLHECAELIGDYPVKWFRKDGKQSIEISNVDFSQCDKIGEDSNYEIFRTKC